MITETVKVPYIKGTVVGFYYDNLGHEKGDILQNLFKNVLFQMKILIYILACS